MKANIFIISIIGIGLSLNACKSINQSESSYYGYNNKPKIEETNRYETSQQLLQPNNYVQSNEVYSSDENYSNQSATIIENNYYFYDPPTFYWYYPWWQPRRNTIVYSPLRNNFYISIGYGYSWYDWYDPFVYYSICSPIVYYPYPVYYPVPYPYYYYHHYGNWQQNYKPVKNTQKDTYRDFGPSRGSYINTGLSNENKTPANRRSGTVEVPTTNSNTKDIFQNTPESRNRRIGMQPAKESFESPSNENTNNRRTESEIKQADDFKNLFDKKEQNVKKGENPFEPNRRTIPQPVYERPSSSAPNKVFEPSRSNPPRNADTPSRNSNSSNNSAPTQKNDQPANKRSQ